MSVCRYSETLDQLTCPGGWTTCYVSLASTGTGFAGRDVSGAGGL